MTKKTNIDDVIDRYKVILLLGPGGVGKTTCSIATAIAGAKQGKKVGLLSIDPAKRLAAALNMPIGNELKEIDLGKDLPGSVEAAMLDQKAVFDSMVRKHSTSEKNCQKILEHKLYIAASAKLAGPLEYMALAKLQNMLESDQYDLIVLDTPPDTHALDFLKRPNILAGFMENRVMSWLVKPFYLASRLGAGKVFSAGGKLMGGVSKVTGFKALSILSEFLVLIQEVVAGFHQSGEAVVEILNRKETAFFLVTTPTSAACRSALNLAIQVNEMGYQLNLGVLNRCLPKAVAGSLRSHQENLAQSKVKSIEKIMARMEGEERIEKTFRSAIKKLLGGTSSDHGFVFHKIDEQDYDIHTGVAMDKFSDVFRHPSE